MNDGLSTRFKGYLAVSFLMVAATSNLYAEGESKPSTPEKDPRALKALQDMGAFMRTLPHLHVIAASDTDQVLDNGQAVQFSYQTEMIATQPDKLRLSVVDGPHQKTLFYNGKQFALFDKEQHYYASGDAPSTIDALVDDMFTRFGMVLPLADLFRWNASTADSVGISSALYIDDQEVNGRLCAHYAYRQPGVDWQLWVRLGPRPLPCRLMIARVDTEGLPRYSVQYLWKEDRPASPEVFNFVPPKGIRPVPLREMLPAAQEARQ